MIEQFLKYINDKNKEMWMINIMVNISNLDYLNDTTYDYVSYHWYMRHKNVWEFLRNWFFIYYDI